MIAAVQPPTKAEFDAAGKLLAEVIVPTALVPLGGAGAEGLWIAPEIHQPAGSFKIRGVHHAVASMEPERRARGISTVSAGNTAKALAWTGRHFGVQARSLMPEHAPRTKIEAVRALGGEVVLAPVDEVFAFLKGRAWEAEPYAFVHPWIERQVMVGHGTLGLEIAQALPAIDTLFVPVGGGGLLAGVGSALRAVLPEVRIVAVEPAGCPSLHAALAAGKPVEVSCETMCDGVAVPYITEEMFPLLRELVDEALLVSEAQVRAAIRRLALANHVVAEGAGALAVAAALSEPRRTRGNAVALVTGGSIDASALVQVLEEGGDT